MKVTVLPGKDLDPELRSVWSELRNTNPELESPFFCHEFTASVASVCNDVEIAVIEENGKIAGFLPFQRGTNNIGAPVGRFLSDYHGVICAPDFECSPIELLKACKLTVWDFDHLIIGQAYFHPFHRGLATSPQIDLSAGLANYVAGRRPVRPELIRRLERDLGPLHLITHSTDTEMLKWVIKNKSDQYRRTQVNDIFSIDWVQSTIECIHSARTGEFYGCLSLLYAGETLIAGHFGIRSNHVLHYWFPTYSINYSKYSPGLSMLLKIIEGAPKIGIKLIDLGKGPAPYKDKFMNAETALAEGSIERYSLINAKRRLRRGLRALIANSPMDTSVRCLIKYMRKT